MKSFEGELKLFIGETKNRLGVTNHMGQDGEKGLWISS